MIGQKLRNLLEPVRVQCLDRSGDPLVQDLSTRAQEGVVHCLLTEHMLEGVLSLRRADGHVDEVQLFQLPERLLQG